MKTTEKYLAEIKEIRKMMEESSRFLTLSGLSGILVGVIALIGAYLVGRMIYSESAAVILLYGSVTPAAIIIAAVVLLLSLLTIVLLTSYRVKKSGKRFWNAGTRMMLVNLAIPLVTGGLLILILLFNGIYEIIIPGTLIFYGLALINAAKFTRQEIFYLGLFQNFLGIVAALLPALGLIIWAFGFGILHIVYGTLMYYRYERNTNP